PYFDGAWDRRYIRDCACARRNWPRGGPLVHRTAGHSLRESEAQHLEFFRQLAREGLIDDRGGIRSRDSVAKLHAVMQRASKLVSKAIMLNILKITEDSSLLSEFCRQGGWQMLNDWLNTACSETNVALQKLLLDVFLRLPVGVDMLQANNTAKVIAKSADSELAPLAANVVERWLACIKAAAEQEAAAAVAATAPESGDDISEDAASSTSRQKKKKDKKRKKKKSKKEKPDREAESVRQQSVPLHVRTAPATFRDTNLLALDELVSEDQQQPAGSKRKQQKQLSGELASSAAFASSGKPAKRARLEQQNDLESIHSSIEVRPTSSLEADPIAVPPSKPSPTSPSSAAVAKPAGVSTTTAPSSSWDSLFGVCRSSLPKIVRKKTSTVCCFGRVCCFCAEKPEAAAEPIGAKQAQSKKQKDKQSEQAQEQQTQKQQQPSKRKRVTWAHFDALEQVFYFELDPSQETGGSAISALAAAQLPCGGESEPAAAQASRAQSQSTERAKQAKRQETMLQVIYFSLDTTPASATEPDVEHFDAEEPIIIPLENATSASAAPTSSGGEAAAETSDPSDAAAATEAAASALSTGAPISATIPLPIADILKQVTSQHIGGITPGGLSSSVPPQHSRRRRWPQQQPPQPASSSDSGPSFLKQRQLTVGAAAAANWPSGHSPQGCSRSAALLSVPLGATLATADTAAHRQRLILNTLSSSRLRRRLQPLEALRSDSLAITIIITISRILFVAPGRGARRPFIPHLGRRSRRATRRLTCSCAASSPFQHPPRGVCRMWVPRRPEPGGLHQGRLVPVQASAVT
uniref:TFIIS N-terminal domain-containing protein n=1 Tax=Macrostomum lignano TaxID=282301 RepID=A0A1I8FJB0_9PLAT